MINIKSDWEIELMREASLIVAKTHKYLIPHIKAGTTTLELDRLAEDFIRKSGAIPSCKNYNGFPATLCISINDEVVHGIPSKRKLVDGDIVSIDVCACYKGYHGDSAWTYKVGEVSSDKAYLMEHTEKALYEGIKQVKPGNRIGDISSAIEKYAKEHNLGIVKELVGHGVGNNLHEDPEVPNYGTSGSGPVLKPGMVIAIEPMLNYGSSNVELLDDDWTVVTEDSSPSAHFEHTVLVTDDGCDILTKRVI